LRGGRPRCSHEQCKIRATRAIYPDAEVGVIAYRLIALENSGNPVGIL
jgi:hypothetical protein